MALLGSILREDFSQESDIDVLVSFAPGSPWCLFELVDMQDELVNPVLVVIRLNQCTDQPYYASICIVLTFMNRIAYFLSLPFPLRGDNILISLNYILRRKLAPDLLLLDRSEARIL
jgi:hypothetical protein